MSDLNAEAIIAIVALFVGAVPVGQLIWVAAKYCIARWRRTNPSESSGNPSTEAPYRVDEETGLVLQRPEPRAPLPNNVGGVQETVKVQYEFRSVSRSFSLDDLSRTEEVRAQWVTVDVSGSSRIVGSSSAFQ